MGQLTGYLQSEFRRLCPQGWVCYHETRLLMEELEEALGYAPRVDVVLERADRSRRLWVEFEVSRADPVANHAKLATSHIFRPWPASDSFVAMVSSHVDRGRRNLASNMVLLMRLVGINAFQTVLFPRIPPDEIKRLNHLDLVDLSGVAVSVEPEI